MTDEIVEAVRDLLPNPDGMDRTRAVRSVLTALRAAGYEIVPKGRDELFRETMEDYAEAVEAREAAHVEHASLTHRAEALAEAAKPFARAVVNYADCGDWQAVIDHDHPEAERVSVAQLRALDAALSAHRSEGGWRPVSDPPAAPVMVEFFHGKVAEAMGWSGEIWKGVRDERRSLGWWDGEAFFDLGTGHQTFEDVADFSDQLPTMYHPLPPAPDKGDQSDD